MMEVRLRRLSALVFALLCPLTVTAAHGADPLRDIIIAVKPGLLAREQIAVPDARVLPRTDAVTQKLAAEMHQVLWDDLRYSGVFEMVSREAYATVRSPTTSDKVPYEEWVAIGASWLVLLEVSPVAGEIAVEGRLFETKRDRKLVLGKRYQSKTDVARRIAHTFADAIIAQVGGEPGVATTQIAFASDRDSGARRGRRELYVVDYDGHGPRRLTGNGKLNMSPEWGPGNAEVAYTSLTGANWNLGVLSRTTGLSRTIWTKPGLNSSPAWSPDGVSIVFASSFQDGNTELYRVAGDGGGLRRLTTNAGIDTNPAWSPNGGELAFTSDRSGSIQIWAMDADGLNLRKLTSQGTFNDGAAWAPGKGGRTRIAYSGRSAGSFQIFVYTVETGDLVQLTDEGSNESPSWSPDGRQLAFASTRGARSDIYIMNDDGANIRRITSGGNNVTPAWSRR